MPLRPSTKRWPGYYKFKRQRSVRPPPKGRQRPKRLIELAEKEGAEARMISWKDELKENPDAPPPAEPGSMNVVQ